MPLSTTPVGSLASAATLAVMGLVSSGCSIREASLVDHPVASVARGPACDASHVEVWEDQLPRGRVIEVGRLRARTLSSDFSILRMQERAAREGYDGIYWIDCAGAPGRHGSGDCSARAFVYARTLAERTAARSAQVAAR